jgi:Rad3-related DNA helicase
MQMAQMKMQAEAALEAQKYQHMEAMKQAELQAAEQLEKWKSELESATKIMVARIGANPGLDLPLLEAQEAASTKIAQELGGNVTNAMNRMIEMHQNMNDMHNTAMDRINGAMEVMAAPKRVVRGADGRVAGVEVVKPILQ